MTSTDVGVIGKKNAIFTVSVALTAIAAVAVAARLPFLQSGGRAATVTAAIFLYLPILIIRKNLDLTKYGASWGGGLRSLAETVILAAVTLFPFYFVFFQIFEPVGWVCSAPQNTFRLVFIQVALVSIPEEFFFRGWLQTDLEENLGRRWKILGAELGPGWLIATLLFGAAHIAADFTPDRLLVFFPGLLFGWLRARTKSIAFPVVLHTLYNVTFIIAQKSISI